MHIKETPLKPLSSIELTADDTIILKWLRSTSWSAVTEAKEPIPYKTKVPEFYSGVRLYRMQAGNSTHGMLELFIKKLGFQGVISKPDLYPVTGHGNQPRYLCLKKADLDNLGVGKEEDEDE